MADLAPLARFALLACPAFLVFSVALAFPAFLAVSLYQACPVISERREQ